MGKLRDQYYQIALAMREKYVNDTVQKLTDGEPAYLCRGDLARDLKLALLTEKDIDEWMGEARKRYEEVAKEKPHRLSAKAVEQRVMPKIEELLRTRRKSKDQIKQAILKRYDHIIPSYVSQWLEEAEQRVGAEELRKQLEAEEDWFVPDRSRWRTLENHIVENARVRTLYHSESEAEIIEGVLGWYPWMRGIVRKLIVEAVREGIYQATATMRPCDVARARAVSYTNGKMDQSLDDLLGTPPTSDDEEDEAAEGDKLW